MALRLLRLPRQQGLDMAGHSPSLVPGPPPAHLLAQAWVSWRTLGEGQDPPLTSLST